MLCLRLPTGIDTRELFGVRTVVFQVIRINSTDGDDLGEENGINVALGRSLLDSRRFSSSIAANCITRGEQTSYNHGVD